MDTTLNTVGIEPQIVHNDLASRAVVSNRSQAHVARKAAAGPVSSFDSEAVQKITEKIQHNIDRMNVSLRFSTYGKDDDRTSVTVVEKETGKVVREIPAEEVQRLQERMEEVIGLIFNGNA